MTSQTQPAQGTRSIQKSFFTDPFRFCSETPEGATGRQDTRQERRRCTQGRLGRRQHPATLLGCHGNRDNQPQPTEKASVGKWSREGTLTAAASSSSAPRCFAKAAAGPMSGSSHTSPSRTATARGSQEQSLRLAATSSHQSKHNSGAEPRIKANNQRRWSTPGRRAAVGGRLRQWRSLGRAGKHPPLKDTGMVVNTEKPWGKKVKIPSLGMLKN